MTKKQIFQLGVSFILCLLILGGITFSAKAKENLTLLKNRADWSRGDSEGLQMTKDGQLTLSTTTNGYGKKGFFITPAIETEADFTHLVPFWNATIPSGTKVTIKAKLKVEKEWSRWIKVATWDKDQPLTYSPSSPKVEVKIDTLRIKTHKANEFRLLIELHSEDKDIAPSVSLVGATYWNSNEKLRTTKSEGSDYLKDLEVPKESQFEEPASVAPLICSPTALSMVLQYYGRRVKPLEVARGVYDHGAEIYGNWAFNTAFAAKQGFETYVRYFPGIRELKEEIADGRPTVVSIAYGEGELEGAPIKSTPGHLVVVRGFIKKGNREYVIINDPAANSDQSVRKTYRLDQFVAAWRGIGYVIKPLS